MPAASCGGRGRGRRYFVRATACGGVWLRDIVLRKLEEVFRQLARQLHCGKMPAPGGLCPLFYHKEPFGELPGRRCKVPRTNKKSRRDIDPLSLPWTEMMPPFIIEPG